MEIQQSNEKTIYVQLADWIIDEILAGTYGEEEQIPSVADISGLFKINHITAMKGIGLLTDSGILYKKRGIGTFVSTGAKEMIREKRKEEFEDKYVSPMVREAKKLNIAKEEVKSMIESEYEKQ